MDSEQVEEENNDKTGKQRRFTGKMDVKLRHVFVAFLGLCRLKYAVLFL